MRKAISCGLFAMTFFVTTDPVRAMLTNGPDVVRTPASITDNHPGGERHDGRDQVGQL